MNDKAKLLLHPVRMQIVQSLVGNRKLTVQEIAKRVSDVPQATLYRHLNKLVQGSVLEVVAQHPVRGTVEKVYALATGGGSIGAEEFSSSTKEEQITMFMQFTSGLLDLFGSYVEQEQVDFARDGVAFRQADLYMTDEEFHEFVQQLSTVFQQLIGNEPTEERRKRTVATIIIPEKK